MSEKKEYKVEVSVIVAVYNAEKYLQQCLDSIAGQTLKNIEILCINDGSTDNSLNILQEYAKKDIRFQIYTKENEGLGGASARNMGLEKAQGKYISILDSDDFFEPTMLENSVKRAEETKADIVVFGGCEYDDKDGRIYKVASILNEKVIPEKEVFSYQDCGNDIYQLTQGMAWNKLYRASFLQKHGLRFQKIKYTDDAFFTFAHMVLAERITVLKEYLCYYRVNSGVSQTDGLANYPDSSYVPYKVLKDFLIKEGAYETVKQSFVNCAASFMRYFYDKINRYEPFAYLHEKFRKEVFAELDMNNQEEQFFYDKRVFLWVKQVCTYSAEEMIFQVARAYGNNTTTGILRFQFPYNKIPRGSKIVLIGEGIMGQHFYSQIILSNYCDVVLWAGDNNQGGWSYIHSMEELKECHFEYAIIAYVQQPLIRPVIDKLKEMGISEERIVIGGECL